LDAPNVRTSILEDCLAEAEEKANRKEPTEDKSTKEEVAVAKVKRETSEAPTEVAATAIPSPPKEDA
jgi:hypothetical protein